MTDEITCVLVVDDEALIALGLTVTLRSMGLRVCGTAATAEQAIALAQQHRPSLVLMDVRLKGQADGVDAAIEIHRTVGSSVIFITGSREPETVQRIQQDHPAGVLFKPILPVHLKAEIDRVFGH
ncbi:response regulator [Azospirillum rugosum]|uniref:DNA-binding NarL/FixJ family response regulator n=1 Tax=Azospirillum rugosum TaxID=416170 RepID=A0ABS4SJX5_9PROT|nr:response regulator [Azospirillum rugosum]MBP2292252.1 DNA-binding NarL/FixJ family response regulator [Azospirillum rugosum]MDQ0526011.1 DNA-binding NarL/FixJ family response regulator [Azospirillum rugosum]